MFRILILRGTEETLNVYIKSIDQNVADSGDPIEVAVFDNIDEVIDNLVNCGDLS
jgi:hypothetical protein